MIYHIIFCLDMPQLFCLNVYSAYQLYDLCRLSGCTGKNGHIIGRKNYGFIDVLKEKDTEKVIRMYNGRKYRGRVLIIEYSRIKKRKNRWMIQRKENELLKDKIQLLERENKILKNKVKEFEYKLMEKDEKRIFNGIFNDSRDLLCVDDGYRMKKSTRKSLEDQLFEEQEELLEWNRYHMDCKNGIYEFSDDDSNDSDYEPSND